eukprot:91395-Rhodomonas_salina.4
MEHAPGCLMACVKGDPSLHAHLVLEEVAKVSATAPRMANAMRAWSPAGCSGTRTSSTSSKTSPQPHSELSTSGVAPAEVMPGLLKACFTTSKPLQNPPEILLKFKAIWNGAEKRTG